MSDKETPIEEITPVEDLLEIVRVETWEDVNASLAAIGIAKARRDELDAQYKQIKAQSEAALAVELAPYDAIIEKHESALNAFAVQHRDEFANKKSRDLVNGTIGFRLSTPAVSQLPKFTAKVSMILIAKSKFRKMFIRFKPSLNKEAILAAAGSKEIDEVTLKGFGLSISQEEGFYAEVSGDRFTSSLADILPDEREEAV